MLMPFCFELMCPSAIKCLRIQVLDLLHGPLIVPLSKDLLSASNYNVLHEGEHNTYRKLWASIQNQTL